GTSSKIGPRGAAPRRANAAPPSRKLRRLNRISSTLANLERLMFMLARLFHGQLSKNRPHLIRMEVQFGQPGAVQDQAVRSNYKSAAGPCGIGLFDGIVHPVNQRRKWKMQFT